MQRRDAQEPAGVAIGREVVTLFLFISPPTQTTE